MLSHGNFLALLKFRVNSNDTVLAEHIEKGAKNSSYTSSGIQNQLITILGYHIRRKILDQVQKAPRFTIIAREVTDTSNKEQLSIVVR